MKGFNVSMFWLIILLIANVTCAPEIYSQDDEITVIPPAIIGISWNSKGDTSNDEFNIVYDDFSFYLNSAVKKLEPLGVKFYAVNKQKVFFTFLNKTDSVDLAKENAFVGYVFISSTGKVLKRFHVITDIEIIELAKKHFDLNNNLEQN